MAKDYPKTWHPGTPKQQSAAQRQIAANKRAAAKKKPKNYPGGQTVTGVRTAKKRAPAAQTKKLAMHSPTGSGKKLAMRPTTTKKK
jgi:hypothetical protein